MFRIPHTAALGMLLAHLGLSPAQYERVVHEDGKIHVTVSFNTSRLTLGHRSVTFLCQGFIAPTMRLSRIPLP